MRKKYPYCPEKMVKGVRNLISHLTMEKKIGREIKPGEVVHHEDKDPANNSIDNLQLMTKAEHNSYHHLGRSWGRHSSESKRKIGIGHRGKKVSDLTREKLSINNCHAKLAPFDVRNIKRMLRDGIAPRLIGFTYKISTAHVSSIKTGRTWKFV